MTHMATTNGIATRGKFGCAIGIPGLGVVCMSWIVAADIEY